MNDIELIQMLRKNVGVSKAACDAAYEAADRIEELSAALTQSRAETAKLLAMNDAGYDTVTYRAVAAAEARGMRKAAVIAYQFEGNDKLRCAILAASKKGGV